MAEVVSLSRAAAPGAAREDRVANITDIVRGLRQGGDAAVIAAARAIAPQLAARAAHHDRTATFPVEDFDDLWRAGLTLLSVPAEAGGVGASLYASAAALRIISGADAATGFILKWHLTRFFDAEQRWPEHLREELLDAILSGPTLIAGVRNEAGRGSPARGGLPATTATRTTLADGSPGWRLNGHKTYGSGAAVSRWIAVWAATDPADGPVHVGSFIIPARTPGLTVVEGSWDHVGMRATGSHDILLEDVLIPQANTSGLYAFAGADPMQARRSDPKAIDWGSILESALYAGVAEAARDWLAPYLNHRAPASLGAPLATLERFQIAVGQIELLVYTNRQLIDGAARRIDLQARDLPVEEPVTAVEAGLIKTAVVENASKAVDVALSLVGNPGLSYHHPLQRFHRDALCGRVHEPQADVLLRAAGRVALEKHKPTT